MNRKIIFTFLLISTITISKGQVGLSLKLTNYITTSYWNLEKLGFDARPDVTIEESINNYNTNQRIFYTVNSVCVDSAYVGYVVAASYRDKDHLGVMRLFFPVIPNEFTNKYNLDVINNIEKVAKLNVLNFQYIEMLKILPTIPEDKKRTCFKRKK